MPKHPLWWGFAMVLVTGCMHDASPPDDGTSAVQAEVGVVRLSLGPGAQTHDVSAVQFSVLPADQTCDGAALEMQTVSLQTLGEAGSAQSLADALFVLAPGSYRACAQPLAEGGPSQQCATAEAVAEVRAGETVEIALISQCMTAGKGGLDVKVSLNDAPVIGGLSIAPSKYVTSCQAAHLTLMASDADDDTLSYAWSTTSPSGLLSADAEHATFWSKQPGQHDLSVTVTDAHQGSASLSVPVHVSSANCEVPAEVQKLFVDRCKGCHIDRASGGLSLASAGASFTNLVGSAGSGMGCTDRVRVVPGNPGASYLVAKLQGSAGICGVRMPRNQAPLSDAEMKPILDWIGGL